MGTLREGEEKEGVGISRNDSCCKFFHFSTTQHFQKIDQHYLKRKETLYNFLTPCRLLSNLIFSIIEHNVMANVPDSGGLYS